MVSCVVSSVKHETVSLHTVRLFMLYMSTQSGSYVLYLQWVRTGAGLLQGSITVGW